MPLDPFQVTLTSLGRAALEPTLSSLRPPTWAGLLQAGEKPVPKTLPSQPKEPQTLGTAPPKGGLWLGLALRQEP